MITFNIDNDFYFTAEPKILAKALKNHFFDSAVIKSESGKQCLYQYVNYEPYFDEDEKCLKDMVLMILDATDGKGKIFGTLASWDVFNNECNFYFTHPTQEIIDAQVKELNQYIAWIDAKNKKVESVLNGIFCGFLYVMQNLQMRPKIVSGIKKYQSHEIPFEAKDTNQKVTIKTNQFTVTIENDNEISADNSARGYTRHVESWEVLGHWRQYKNGKRIFIKPYTKGKGKIKDTVYQFE